MLQIVNLGYYNNDGKGLVWHGSDASETQKIKLLQTLLGVKADGIFGKDTTSAVRKKYAWYYALTTSQILYRIDTIIANLQEEMLAKDKTDDDKTDDDKTSDDKTTPWYSKYKWYLIGGGALAVTGLVVAKNKGALGDLSADDGGWRLHRSARKRESSRSRFTRVRGIKHTGKAACADEKDRFFKMVADGRPCPALTVLDRAKRKNCAWAKRSTAERNLDVRCRESQ